jgi:putative NADH-flavin reductase
MANTTVKNVLVLGATGRTGQHLVAQALQLGYQVTAFVRDSSRLAITSDRLRVLTGDVREGDALTNAVRGQDVVISALGVGDSFKPNGLIGQSAPRIVQAMESAGVRRLIFTSGFGVGETYRDAPLPLKFFSRLLLKDIYRDKAAGEVAIRASGLDWTIVYPTGMVNKPARGNYRAGERLSLRGFATISRADVADFLLKQIEDTTYVRKSAAISW